MSFNDIKNEADRSEASISNVSSSLLGGDNLDAAEAAVAKLGSIMDDNASAASFNHSLKRKSFDTADGSLQASSSGASNKKKKPLTEERREERNMREKERSLKITQQIHELRNLLSSGGVIVPKGTKSTILTEAANYIRLLQQQQHRSELDKQQLVQEVQRIGGGAIGQQASVAIRHLAAQNGIDSVVNFGNEPVPTAVASAPQVMQDSLGDRDFRIVFNSCSVGMAIATMGGSFIDCNTAFTQLSSYTKQELKAMTIFNITSRDDLQGAFDMMSKLITPPTTSGFDADGNNVEDATSQAPVVLRSAIRHRSDLGLSVSLVRGEDGVAKYFNITLVKLPSSLGIGAVKPVPATAEMSTEPEQAVSGLQQVLSSTEKQGFQGNLPTYTAG
jgi:PAS domain S-box-containing protein